MTEHRHRQRALLLMTAAAVLFGLMAFSAKLAAGRLSGSQVAFVRFVVGLLPVIVVPRYRRSALTYQRLDLLFYRGFFGGVAVLFYFLAIEHTSVGVATLLNYTAPIFSGVFSMLFIGERFSSRVLLALPVAFVGVFLVVQANARPGDVLGFGPWQLLGLCSAIASGAAVTAMRAARRGENSWAVYTSFCFLGALVTAPFGIATWKTPTPREWLFLIATSLFAIGAQLLLTFSLRWVDAMTVGVISQLAVVITIVLGAVVLHDKITAMAVVGSILTIGGVVGVIYITSTITPRAAADEVVPEA